MAEDVIRRNPFDFILTKYVPNDSKHREALSPEDLETWMDFVKNDKTYSKYYDEFIVLLGTGISRYYQEGYHKAIEIERDRKEKIRETSDRNEKIELLSEIYIGEAVFSTRTSNSLRRAGMTTLGDVACTEPSELLKIRNVGEVILAEIKRVLADYGFEMGEK